MSDRSIEVTAEPQVEPFCRFELHTICRLATDPADPKGPPLTKAKTKVRITWEEL